MKVQFVRTLTIVMLCTVSTAVFADPVFIGESDTGIIFGDLDCQITATNVDPNVKLSDDSFGYLYATVHSSFSCVDRDGISHNFSGQDTVLFPLAQLDWSTQTWSISGKSVARRNPPYGVAIAEDTESRLWTFSDDTHLTFKVEFWKQ